MPRNINHPSSITSRVKSVVFNTSIGVVMGMDMGMGMGMGMDIDIDIDIDMDMDMDIMDLAAA